MGWGKAGIASPNVSCYRWTVKFCRFWDSARGEGTGCGGSGTGLTCDFGSYGNDLDPSGHIIYGSIFYSSAVGGGRNSCFQFGGSGFTNSTANNCKAFNNTFVGIPEDPTQGHISFNGAQTGGGGPGTGNEARNNLWWDCVGVASVVANSSSNNVDATVNPFIAGGYPTTLDFRISSTGQARNAGTDVGSPYNVDPLGVTRSAGSWDVGAYEYDAGGSAPNAPTNLRLV
jgi:hypothetical protein